MVSQLEAAFPVLRTSGYRITSPPYESYNCIAWTAGVNNDWWWPGDPQRSFWPAGVARELTVNAFEQAFATIGYAKSPDANFESGKEKVAIYALPNGLPKHAARQLPTGRWTSKLGKMEDIEHDLRDLEGSLYGRIECILERQITPSSE